MARGGLSCSALADLQPAPVASEEDWEASEVWLEAAVKQAKCRQPQLFAYFRVNKKEDLTPFVTRTTDQFLQQVAPLRQQQRGRAGRQQQEGGDGGPDSGSGGEGGGGGDGKDEADGGGGAGRQDQHRIKHLYYGVLHHALSKLYPMTVPAAAPRAAAASTASRFERPAVPASDAPRVCALLSIPVFHTSLLAVAAMLVRALQERDPTCLGATPALFLRTAHAAGFEPNMLALWNAARWFQEAYVLPPAQLWAAGAAAGPQQGAAGAAAAWAGPLPALPGRYVLGRLMRLAEERGVLAEGSTFYAIVHEGAEGGFTEGDRALVRAFLESYARRATARASVMAELLLRQLPHSPHPGAAVTAAASAATARALFPELAARLVDRALSESLDLAFNQHMSVVVACSIYMLARALKGLPHMSFAAVTRAFPAVLPDHSSELFEEQVELRPARAAEGSADGSPPPSPLGQAPFPPPSRSAEAAAAGAPLRLEAASLGAARAFYNATFLPRMEATVRVLVREALDAASKSGAAAAAEAEMAAPAGGTGATAGGGCFSFPATDATATAASTTPDAATPPPQPPACTPPLAPRYAQAQQVQGRKPAASAATSVASLGGWNRGATTLPQPPVTAATPAVAVLTGAASALRQPSARPPKLLSVLADEDEDEDGWGGERPHKQQAVGGASEQQQSTTGGDGKWAPAAPAASPHGSAAKGPVLRLLRPPDANTAAAAAAVAAAAGSGLGKKPLVLPSLFISAAAPGPAAAAAVKKAAATAAKENEGFGEVAGGAEADAAGGGRRRPLRQYR